MRVFIAALATETNTFSPFPTGRLAFHEAPPSRDGSREGNPQSNPALMAWRRLADAAGDDVIESWSAHAQPAGVTVRAVYEALRDAILDDLKQAQAEAKGNAPIDVILLALHGAMVAEGIEDCEGDLLAHMRALAPAAAIGTVLDLHCHLTPAMMRHADFVVPCREYPHIDFGERATELFTLCRQLARGEIRPVGAWVDTKMIGVYPTFDEPMRGIVAGLHALEKQRGVLSVGIAHGFPWADVADVGTRVLAYADAEAALAADAALAVARRLYSERDALRPRYPDLASSLARAATLEGPIVLGDYGDNPGGGAPGDSTFFLRALLNEPRQQPAAIGCFFDPSVALLCADAGVGARLTVRLGGKHGPMSGDPIDVEVEVTAARESHHQGVFGTRRALGRSVALRHGHIHIAVVSTRTQTFEPDAFTGLDITLADKHLVAVKSSSHFEAGFKPIARHLWRVATPGTLGLDLAALPYTRRDGHFHPRISDPWATHGEPRAVIVERRR